MRFKRRISGRNSGYTTAATFALATLVLFQNCDGFQAIDLLGSKVSSVGAQNANGTNRDVIMSLESAIPAEGYIFRGKYGVNPLDPKGRQVCDYPALTNCRTKEGDAVSQTTGLQPSSRLHVMGFDFQSNGFFSNNPNAHFAVGLRGHLTRDANKTPVAINGRGFIVGTLGSDARNNSNPACGKNMIETESYHGDAGLANPAIPYNHVFSDTCTDAVIAEGAWYHLELYVSADRKIGFKVFDEQSRLLHSNLMQDPYSYLGSESNDLFFGHVFGEDVTSPTTSWDLIVKNVRFSQIDAPIESYFQNTEMSFILGATALANNTSLLSEQAKNAGLYVGPFAPARTRFFACANKLDRVDAGVSCLLAKDFRVVDFAGDESFTKAGASLRVLDGPLKDYPPDKYKLVIRLNPESSWNQATVQVDTRDAQPTPPVPTGPPLSAPASMSTAQVIRSYSVTRANHFYSIAASGFALPPNYSREGAVFDIFVTDGENRTPLYECETSSDYFLSTDAPCEGKKMVGRIGFLSKSPSDGKRPLYRCLRDTGHFSTVDSSECTSNGFAVELVLGYVP